MSKTLDSNEPVSEYRVFKFKAINKCLIDSLVMSRLWCAKPDTLNDPLDCRIDLHEAWKRACSSATGGQKDFLQRVLDDPQGFFKNMEGLWGVGICSFSSDFGKHPSASVQWSHYADEHKGVRLLYHFPKSFAEDPQTKIYDVKEVTYKDNVLTNWLMSTNLGGPDFLNVLAAHYFTAKSPAWKHEREVRIIRRESGFLDIPFGFLEQVCFGLRTPQADIELVEKLAREYCGCKKFCQIVPDGKSDFGIRAKAM